MAAYDTFLFTLHLIAVTRFNGVHAKPIEADVNVDPQSLSYLSKFGYLDASKGTGQLKSTHAVATALKRFQRFAGIPVTGKLDKLTKEYMIKPRCGLPDLRNGERTRRKRRYNHQGSTWKNLHLTWALETSNNDGISDYQVRYILTRAFNKWNSVTNLYFRELRDQPENTAQIRVRFVSGVHGDPYPFDGPGNIIAHAFYPMNNLDLSGDVHFDDDEEFVLDRTTSRRQRKLLWVAVHEIGHAIGLEHSDVAGAIMWPYYQHFESNDFNLTHDDIRGIQMLYGGKYGDKETTKAPRPVPTKSPKIPGKEKCVASMSAAFVAMNNKLHFFHNNKLYVLYNDSREGIEAGPLPVSKYFRSLRKVDAVFTHPYFRSHTIFHGDTFSVYEENNVRHGNKRYIKYGFQGIKEKLQNVDAAIIWPSTRKLYIFKGERYWRLSPISGTRDYSAEYGYPQSIAVKWNGLPKTIDAAFKWTNNKIYFTKGDLYYRWDERLQKVHSGYPLKLTRSFLKCDVK